MKSPALALFWHSWRLSRRWYLVVLTIAMGLHFTVLNLTPEGMAGLPNLREHLAPGSVLIGMMLALFSTLLAISLGGQAGFPLRFEFRLPVSTATLVGIPMLTLALLCASLYVFPLLLSRLVYGLPMPLLAGAVMICLTAVLLAAGSWLAAGTSSRALTLLLAVVFGAMLFVRLQPIRIKNGTRTGEHVFDPDMISLPADGYMLVLVTVLVLYMLTMLSVRRQRQGESWRLFRRSSQKSSGGGSSSVNPVLDWTRDLLDLPCPTSRPWLAEAWFEFRCHGLPVLSLGVVLALLMPLLALADTLFSHPVAGLLASAPPLVLFLTGIGIALFNRRVASGGYMDAFEGTRGLGTLQLAGVQFGTLGLALIVGLGLMAVSLWFSASNFGSIGPLWSHAADLFAPAGGQGLTLLVGKIVTAIAGLFVLLGFFFCAHSCSTFWGRKVMYFTLALLIYAAFFVRAVVTSESAGGFVAANMWWISVGTFGLTLVVLTGVVARRLLDLRSGLGILLMWLPVAACIYIAFLGTDRPFRSLPAELQAFTLAGQTLPLALLLATLWCHDRLRHR